MENRKNLHDYGLLLIFLGVLNLFMFIETIVAAIVSGELGAVLATVEPDISLAVNITLGVMGGLMALLVFADALIGLKALKVSKNPSAAKGYITVAKIFFVLSLIATVSAAVTLIKGNADMIKSILNLANTVLSVAVYFIFIKSATAVRNDFINGAN